MTPAQRRSMLGLVLFLATGTAIVQWWAGRQEQDIGQRMAALAKPGDIRMLSSTTCGICTAARLWMTRQQVPFDECFIERDDACADQFRATLAPGTPVIIVKGKATVGFNPKRLLDQLAAGGT